jgi:hypothetical protein
MITRSKARAIKKAQDELKSRQPTQTHAPLQQPPSRVIRDVHQERQPNQVIASSHHQVQVQHADIEAALLEAIAQMAADQNQAGPAGAPLNQNIFDETPFDAAALENQATVRARFDLMRTSCKIAWDYFRILLMACQASAVVHQKIMLISPYFATVELSRLFGLWLDIVAVALLVMLLHLFNVLCARRIWARESLAERIAASAAFFLAVGEFLKENLEWALIVRIR